MYRCSLPVGEEECSILFRHRSDSTRFHLLKGNKSVCEVYTISASPDERNRGAKITLPKRYRA